MKTILPILLILLMIGGYFYFSKKSKDTSNTSSPTASAPEIEGQEISKDFQGSFVFSAEESTAKWTGSKKIIKDYYDTGTIKIKSGLATFENGKVQSGEIVFDMTSISGETTSNTKAPVTKLTDHLKSEDFFNVEKYPTATYKVISSEKTNDGHTLMGELTLTGKTAPLNVDIVTATENGNAIIAGVANIDRSKWDIKYGSDSFFDDLGDNVINDMFTLEFKVVAKP